MTAGRVATRAGRKIRNVAPGHVVDVATGIEIVREGRYAFGSSFRGPGWAAFVSGCETWGRSMAHVARAEAVCVLVRFLAFAGAVRS